jgi:hypothetical protein
LIELSKIDRQAASLGKRLHIRQRIHLPPLALLVDSIQLPEPAIAIAVVDFEPLGRKHSLNLDAFESGRNLLLTLPAWKKWELRQR